MTKEKKISSDIDSRGFWQRKSVKIIAGIIVGMALVLFSLPFAAKAYLQKWLVENGADTAIIEKVRFNLFTGVAALEGVNVRKDGNTVFSDSTIYLNVGLKNLLGREAFLQQVTLADVLVDIESSEDGSIRIGSYSMAAQQPGIDDKPDEIAIQEKAGHPWILRAKTINIQNVTIRYQQPDLAVELVIEEALIERISTNPDERKGGKIRLKGTVNGAPINLNLTGFVIDPEVKVQGDVFLSDVQLDDLADFMSEYLKPFTGSAGLDGKVAFTMAANSDLRVAYDGLIRLDQGEIGGDDWGGTKGTIMYKGKASFSMTQDDMVVDVDGDLQALQAAFDMPDPVIDIANSDISIKGKTVVTIAEEVIIDTSASLKLAPTTFSMDILKTSAGETTWDGNVQVETGTATKELLVRADGVLNVAEPSYSMDIDGSLMEVSSQMLLWDGKFEYTMGIQEDSKSFVRTDGTLKGEVTAFSLPGVIQINQHSLDLAGKTEVAIGEDLGVFYQGEFTFDDTSVEMEGITIGDTQLSWSGKAGYELGTGDQQTVTLNGELQGENIYTDVAGMHISQQSLITKADCSLTLAESPGFKGTLSVHGETSEIKKGETVMLNLAEFSMANAGDNGSGGIIIESFQLQKLDIPASADIPVTVAVPQVVLNNIQSPDFLSASIDALIVEQPLVVDAEGKVQLAALKSITVDALKIAKDMTVTADELTAVNGVFLKEEKKDALATLAKLQADQLSYSLEEGFVCNTVGLDSMYGNFLRTKSPDSEETQKEVEIDTADDPKTEQTVSGIPVKINQVKVTGKSGFKFLDKSLVRSFKSEFAIKSFLVDDIDLNKPEHPFSYTLTGTFDKYSPLDMEGKCAPLAANFILEQKASLQNLSMMNVSPYTIDAIGAYFPDGELDFSSQLKLGDRIDMDNNLVFTDLEVETMEGDLAKELDNQLPIPLGLALSMLRKHDGSIDLDIPIEGELSALHVGMTDIIVTALGKGITVAVTPYLAYTVLGPAGALAFIGAKVGQSLLDTGLPVLEFEPGAQELTEEHEVILKEVGEKIKNDTEMTYSICAKVTLDELSNADNKDEAAQAMLQNEAIRKELFELGEHRALLVKDYLLSNFKIDEEQLLICNPGFEFKEGSKPKVLFKSSEKK